MRELIPLNRISIGIKASTWREAIECVGALLYESDCITLNYIEEIEQSVEALGPYFVLMPGFALAHAAPSQSVKKSAMSLITLATPVNFGSVNDPVKVILCLSCVDHTSHLDLLSEIASKLMEDDFIDTLYQCSTTLEIYNLINDLD